jgi:hypothetical protein
MREIPQAEPAPHSEEVAPYLLAHLARHNDTAESFARLIEESASDPTTRS